MIRFFDCVFSLLGLSIGGPVLLFLWVVLWISTGAPLYRQERVGRFKKPFTLLKFRTMNPDVASIPTHLARASAVTKVGKFLRKTKLDELPQLWNVLRGEMSLVGPRPCLYSQTELIGEREARDIFAIRPGITGLAQLTGLDMSTPTLLAQADARMIEEWSLRSYFKYIFWTLVGGGSGDPLTRR